MTSGDWLPAQAPFDLVRRGYSPEQVTAHLERLEYDLRIATANRDATNQRLSELGSQLATAQAEADILRAQLDRTALEPVSMSGLSDRMQRMIRLAEEEANDIRGRAQLDADRLRAQLDTALAESAEARSSFDSERERTRKQLAEQVHGLIAEATAEAADTRAQAGEESARLLQEANAEADHTVNEARRYAEHTVSEANQAAAAERAEARAETDQLRAQATAETDQLRAQATAETDQLRAQAKAETEQLRAETREAADQLLSQAAETAATLTAEATAERERINAETLAHHAQVQDDFEIAITARRQDAAKTIADREASSAAAAAQLVAEAQATAHKLVADATAESELLMQRATTYANALVNRAAAESHQRVADADQAIAALHDLRNRVLDQLQSLYGHLTHIRDLAGGAPAMLTPPDIEARRPRREDFPADPAGRPTDVALPVPVLETGSPNSQPGEPISLSKPAESNPAGEPIQDRDPDQSGPSAGKDAVDGSTETDETGPRADAPTGSWPVSEPTAMLRIPPNLDQSDPDIVTDVRTVEVADAEEPVNNGHTSRLRSFGPGRNRR